VLAFLFIKRPEHVWIVYILALLQEALWTFADPARRASIPNICRPEELNLANALGGATWSVMLAVGAAFGGFVTGWFGWQTAIIIDAFTFLISAILLSTLVLPPLKKKIIKKPSLSDYLGISDLREGCRYVANHSRVGLLLLIKSGWALSGGVLVMLTIFGEQVFATEGQSGQSGILYSARGIGAAIGPIMAWRILGESRHAMSKAIGASFFISSIAYLFFSQMPTLAWAALFVLIGHMAGSVQWIFSTTLLQREVDDQFRGRVFAAEMALLTLVLSLSTWATGLALESGMDPRQVTIYLAIMFLVPGTTWTYIHRHSLKK
jgi:predicted MFS family arabinose efflux permease